MDERGRRAISGFGHKAAAAGDALVASFPPVDISNRHGRAAESWAAPWGEWFPKQQWGITEVTEGTICPGCRLRNRHALVLPGEWGDRFAGWCRGRIAGWRLH